jgi:hypothetical protein
MADLILNEALGRGLPFIQNVEDNSPAAAVLRIHAWVSTAADNDIRDVTDGNVDDVAGITNVAEATNGGYANLSLDETDITITVDDTNDRVDVVITDQVFTSVSAGDNWTDISMAYDDLGTDVDTGVQVLYWWDFVVTPNGGDITADFPATAAIRYAQA